MIKGLDNIIDRKAVNVIIVGDGNFVGASKNVVLLNTSGVTVLDGASDVLVSNSSNMTIKDSGVTIINNVEIKQGGLSIQSGILEGGENEVVDINKSTEFHIVEGGKNELRSEHATSTSNLIDGGEDAI